MYPGIRNWLRTKVAPELPTAHRTAFLLTHSNNEPIAAAVFKRETRSKICHVQVRDDLRDQNIGKFLFCLAALELGGLATEVHFTLPEDLWVEESPFFSAFGFERARIADQQYRIKNRELSCAAPFGHFWQAVLSHMPSLVQTLGTPAAKTNPSLIMSVRPQFADAILNGNKVVEIRRSFSDRWINQRVSLYASRPEQSLVGEATISAVTSGSPDQIWSVYGDQAGCTRDEFDSYSRGATTLFAIGLTHVHSYERPLPLSAIRAVAGEQFNPPQSYRRISVHDSLRDAVTLAQAVDSMLPTVHISQPIP
jgi:predicted transcriptional regulator